MSKRIDYQIDKWERDILKSMKKTTRKRELGKIGDFTLDMVLARTRRGFGVKKSGAPRKLFPRNSVGWIEHRKEFARVLDSNTKPGKSNVTYTGQMLKSLRVKTKRLGFIIEPTGIRKGEALSNKKLAGYLSKMRRTYLNLSDLEQRKVKAQFRRLLKGFIKR